MTMRDALDTAMHRETSDEALETLKERGLAIVDLDTMSTAVHDVYCGIMADHEHPNEKDRDQARQLLEAMQKRSAA
jgi:hypothetical protein